MAVGAATEQLIQPPEGLVRQVEPAPGKQGYAFPLQTEAWLKMQVVVTTALAFPLTKADFAASYGNFTDQGAVEEALAILGEINTTVAKYGDPKTLISALKEFAEAEKAPGTLYGHAVWLAAQTQGAAQQIRALLEQGLKDIGENPSPEERLKELKELLTGKGGVESYATALKEEIKAFEGEISNYYVELNDKLTGPTNSMQSYLNQSGNVLSVAKAVMKTDDELVESLGKEISKLNEEYIGFTVAASVSPVLLLIPFGGISLAIADATTFAVLATKVKEKLEGARKQLAAAEEDDRKKHALVAELEQFNHATEDVGADGKAFLDALGTMSGGWVQFEQQIDLRLQALTVADVEDWSAFMTRLGFETAVSGWHLIEEKAEQFFQAGFVKFSTQASL